MTTLLVDGPNILIRGIRAGERSGLHSSEGVPTAGILFFINSMAHHLREERPDSAVVCWDGGQSRVRLGLYPRYKETRRKKPKDESIDGHFELAKTFLSLANIHHVERDGVEADDLIARYWRMARPLEDLVILSSDHDLLQLVGERTTQVKVSSRPPDDRWDADRVDREGLARDLGCAPRHLPYVMALMGDKGDCQPLGTEVMVRKSNDQRMAETFCSDLSCVCQSERSSHKWNTMHCIVCRKLFLKRWFKEADCGYRCQGCRITGYQPDAYGYVHVPIQEVQVGDRVPSWGKNGSLALERVLRTKREPYSGELIKVETQGGEVSRYTPGHRCIASLGDLAGRYCTYLMRKGDLYRVGSSRLGTGRGENPLRSRMTHETADAAWVLTVHTDKEDCLIAEQVISYRYGIPDLRFIDEKRAEALQRFWATVEDLSASVKQCLADHGRLLEHPYCTPSGRETPSARLAEVRACNLMTGMTVAVTREMTKAEKRGTGQKKTIVVSREQYEGDIFSLEVSGSQRYIADGILTHNSVPGLPGIGPVKARRMLAAHDWSWLRLLDHGPLTPEQRDLVQLSLRLVDLRDGPGPMGLVLPQPGALRPTRPGDALYEPLLAFLRRYELESVERRLLAGDLWPEPADAPAARG